MEQQAHVISYCKYAFPVENLVDQVQLAIAGQRVPRDVFAVTVYLVNEGNAGTGSYHDLRCTLPESAQFLDVRILQGPANATARPHAPNTVQFKLPSLQEGGFMAVQMLIKWGRVPEEWLSDRMFLQEVQRFFKDVRWNMDVQQERLPVFGAYEIPYKRFLSATPFWVLVHGMLLGLLSLAVLRLAANHQNLF
jgi:hypothetical protein